MDLIAKLGPKMGLFSSHILRALKNTLNYVEIEALPFV
jgi:hypothetical protein